MNNTDKLKILLEEYGGTITTAEANAAGISNEGLRLLVSSGTLERVSHGVYISPDAFLDKMFVLQKRFQRLFIPMKPLCFCMTSLTAIPSVIP